jgi:hypothetical protein
MKKLIFQSLLTIAGASLLILPIAPFKAIATQNSTPLRIDRHLQNLPSGLVLATTEHQSDERSVLLPKTLTARRMEGGPGGGGAGGRGRINTPSQSPKSSNIPVKNVYSSLNKSPDFPKCHKYNY